MNSYHTITPIFCILYSTILRILLTTHIIRKEIPHHHNISDIINKCNQIL